jgi:tetratricopeptide (TPR) repeat protein
MKSPRLLTVLAAATTCLVGSFFCPASRVNAQWNPGAVNPVQRAKAMQIYNQAVAAFANGDYPTTIQLCKQGENIDNSNKELFNIEAMAYAQAGDNYNAMVKFRQALSLDYNYITCRNNYGVFLNKIGKTKDAKKAFEECTRIDPKYPDAHYHLGQIYERDGDLDKAIEEYQTAANCNPNYADAQRDLGLCIYQRVISGLNGELEPAVEKLKIAAQLAPESALVHYHLGRVLCSTSKLDEAEAEFRTALMKDPQMASAHYELGKLRYFRGDPYRAVDETILAERVPKGYADSKSYPALDIQKNYELMAKSYEAFDDFEHADTAWRKFANMQQNNASIINHIGDLEQTMRKAAKRKNKTGINPAEVQSMVDKGISQVDNGDLEGAKQSFSRAVELDPNSFGGLQNLGEVLEAQNDLNGAMQKYQAACQVKPKYDGLYYNQAYVLEKMGLTADAGTMYQKFHEVSGRYPYDSKHIVSLQQNDARQRARDEMVRTRGF